MRYWQITTSRMSQAAKKLDFDGEWHPFQTTSHAWYRVWKKKLIQRVNFESEQEERHFLPYFRSLEALPEMATVSGFREELNIQSRGDELFLELPLGYVPEKGDSLFQTLEEYGFQKRIEENLLYAIIPIIAIEHEELVQAQRYLTAVRLYYQAASQGTSLAIQNAARAVFEKLMHDETDQ